MKNSKERRNYRRRSAIERTNEAIISSKKFLSGLDVKSKDEEIRSQITFWKRNIQRAEVTVENTETNLKRAGGFTNV